MTADCIDDNDAARFIGGSLDERARLRIERHLDDCVSCRVLLAELARQTATLRRPETLLPPGVKVGRYLLGGVLGAGAMGVVYSAEDPQLGRHVALKLLRPRALTPTGSTMPADDSPNEARLLDEAHALAQLSHPNVVTVFDAGRWQDQVFIALELVRGGTLGEWLLAGPRSLAEVLAHFRAAGAGLAAAHAAGIVHRDFKPDNVLVGGDGRVRVTDFGLARSLAAEGEAGAAGTPAYMAPEQREGVADARSDQYSFSVALWEALCGKLPQAGADRKHAGVGRVPGRIRRAVERGLSRDPAARHPSMAALLAALAWDEAARRRRFWVGALLLALAAGTTLALARSSERARLCRGGADRFARVVSAERLRALPAPAAGEGPLAAEAAQRRNRRLAQLGEYRARWIDLYGDACAATRLRGDQSEELMELRMSCLESRLQGVDTLVGLLERNDPALEQRLAGREVLEPLEPCADRAALLEPLRPPRDAATRTRVETARAALGRVQVLDTAGEFKSARKQAAALVAEARTIGYRPLLAEALVRLASAEGHDSDSAAERDWLEAAMIGEASHHDRLVASARTSLLWTVALQEGHADQAERLEREAEAALQRIGGDDEIETFLLDTRAGLADSAESEKLYLQLIARLQKNTGSDRLALGQAENNLATVYLDRGEAKQALPHFERAIAVEEPLLGAHHPAVLLVRRNRVEALGAIGHARDVTAEARALLADTEAAVGPDHLDTGYALWLYGDSLGDDAATRSEALAPLTRALAVFSAKGGEDLVAGAHGQLCETLVALERFGEARPHCQAMLQFAEKQPGQNHLDLCGALIWNAQLLLGTGAAAQARAQLERALALGPATWTPELLAIVQFAQARALAATHGDRERARELASRAEAWWAHNGDDEQRAQARAWLKAH